MIGNGLGVEHELRMIEGMGDCATILFSGQDEVRAAFFVLASYFSDEISAEGVSVGDPTDVGQLARELSALFFDGFRVCFHHIFLDFISIITYNIIPCNTFLQLFVPLAPGWPPSASVSPENPRTNSSNSSEKVCRWSSSSLMP